MKNQRMLWLSISHSGLLRTYSYLPPLGCEFTDIHTVLERGVKILQNGEKWSLSNMIYANDAVLMGSSERDMKRLAESFAEVCKCCCFEVNVGKSKMLIDKREGESVYECNVQMDGEKRAVVEEFEYRMRNIEVRFRWDVSRSLDQRVEESIPR